MAICLSPLNIESSEHAGHAWRRAACSSGSASSSGLTDSQHGVAPQARFLQNSTLFMTYAHLAPRSQ